MDKDPVDPKTKSFVTRRGFLQAAAAGTAGLTASRLQAGASAAAAAPAEAVLSEAIARLRYLTPAEEFREFEREKPRIDQLTPEKLREVGLDRETWKLEVVPDPESNSKVERPLSKEQGTALEWQEARILPPPEDWGGGLPGGKLPPAPLQFEATTGKPRSWPLRYAIAHRAAALSCPRPGKYHLRCRTIDAGGIAQPLPRPLPRSGNNAIQQAPLIVEA